MKHTIDTRDEFIRRRVQILEDRDRMKAVAKIFQPVTTTTIDLLGALHRAALLRASDQRLRDIRPNAVGRSES
jgi:hypothetical protein